MTSRMKAVKPGRYTLYEAQGKLDGHEASVYTVKGMDRITIATGASSIFLSTDAARELAACLEGALKAVDAKIPMKQGGGA